MKGKIIDWKDDRGFGFIAADNQSDKIFFHISDIKTKERRPRTGDLVSFDVIRDAQKRLKAQSIVIENPAAAKNSKVNRSNVEPVKKVLLDYVAITVLLVLIGGGGFIVYETKNPNHLIPFGVAAILIIMVLLRQKKPKEKHFTCARCKGTARFDKRTIQAWNRGMDKLYCSACHQQWLSTQPAPLRLAHSGGGGGRSGCLGILIVLIALPVMIFISLYPLLT